MRNPCSTEMKSSKTVKGKWRTNYHPSRDNIVKGAYLLKRSPSHCHLSIGALSFEKRIYQSYGMMECKDAAHFQRPLSHILSKRQEPKGGCFSAWQRHADEKISIQIEDSTTMFHQNHGVLCSTTNRCTWLETCALVTLEIVRASRGIEKASLGR